MGGLRGCRVQRKAGMEGRSYNSIKKNPIAKSKYWYKKGAWCKDICYRAIVVRTFVGFDVVVRGVQSKVNGTNQSVPSLLFVLTP